MPICFSVSGGNLSFFCLDLASALQSSHDNTLRKGFQRLQENNKNIFEHSSGMQVRQRNVVGGPISSHHHQLQKISAQGYHRQGLNLKCSLFQKLC